MCVSSRLAQFSSTTVYAAEVPREGKIVHVMGYQNVVQDLAPGKGGNAMILPIPAVAGTLTPANLVSTDKCPTVLKMIAEVARPKMRGAKSFALNSGPTTKRAPIVFKHGIYEFVLAFDARDVPAALVRVSEEKRPTIESAFFDSYDRWYPNYSILLGCFDNAEAAEAAPLLLWYEPMNPEELFLPALDGHTGDVPDLTATVTRDHFVIASAIDMIAGNSIPGRSGLPSDVAALVGDRVIGASLPSQTTNGDILIPVEELRQGRFVPRVAPPPGADNAVRP